MVQEGQLVQSDPESNAAGWIPPPDESLIMTMPDDPARATRVRHVRRLVAAGAYRPPAEAVAERLIAFSGVSLGG